MNHGADDEFKELSRPVLLLAITGQSAAFVVIGVILWHISGRELADLVSFDAHEMIAGVAVGLFLIGSAWLSFRMFPDLADRLIRMQGSTYSFLREPLAPLSIVWVSICVGVGEELLFRGGLQTIVQDYTTPIVAILASSVPFTLMHMAKPLVSLLLFAISVFFGIVYWLTGSLILVIIAHALYDVFAVAYLQRELHRIGFFSGKATKKHP